MKINIEELENLPDKKLTIEFNEEITDLNNQQPVVGEITFSLTSFMIKARGQVSTNVKLECDRCLKEFVYPLTVDLNETFVKGNIIPEEKGEFELTGDDFVEDLQDNTEIDVTELIYQSIILNIPSQKLCNDQCPGSTELQKLNKEKTIDPRMQIFKDISDKIK